MPSRGSAEEGGPRDISTIARALTDRWPARDRRGAVHDLHSATSQGRRLGQSRRRGAENRAGGYVAQHASDQSQDVGGFGGRRRSHAFGGSRLVGGHEPSRVGKRFRPAKGLRYGYATERCASPRHRERLTAPCVARRRSAWIGCVTAWHWRK